MNSDHTTYGIIAAAIMVHRRLGPGLLESAYEACMVSELGQRGLHFERQRPVSLVYDATPIECAYRLDFVVENQVIVELKSVAKLYPVHTAQILTYLKLSGLHIGLLVNFNVSLLKDGIRRFVLDLPEDPRRPRCPRR